MKGMFKRTPLHLAVISGHTKIVQIILQNGGNPLCKDAFGFNSITYAQNLQRKDI